MPRKGDIGKREVAPDPVYGSTLVTKFVNSMMYGGKKSTAQGIFYEAMNQLEKKGGDEALKLFKKAVENAKPVLEVNASHPLVQKLDASPNFHDLAHILFDQALLAEGGMPEDPAAYVKRVNALLA